MPLQVSITNIKADGQQLRVAFNVIPSGNYSPGGDTLDFTKAVKDPLFTGIAEVIESSLGPVSLDVWDAGGNLANGVFPVLGTTQTNSKVKFTTAFNTELTGIAYPGSITGSKLQGEAIFPRLI
jgi:hypothetical protein